MLQPNSYPRQPSLCEFIVGEELHDFLEDISALPGISVSGLFSLFRAELDEVEDTRLANMAMDVSIDYHLRNITRHAPKLPPGEEISVLT